MKFDIAVIHEVAGALAVICLVAAAYGAILRRVSSENFGKFIIGTLLGGIAMLEMFDPIQLSPGVIADLRNLPVALAAGFLGFAGLLPAATIAIATRIWIGGTGMEEGVAAILILTVLGLLWHYRFMRLDRRTPLHLVLLAVVPSIAMISAINLPTEVATYFFAKIAPTFTALQTIGILAAGAFIEREERLLRAERRLRSSAVIDRTTGFLNRAGYFQAMDQAVGSCLDARGCAQLLIDVQYKSWLKSTWGSPAVDRVMAGLARKLSPMLRNGDTCGIVNDGTIAVYLPDISESEVRAKAALIQRELSEQSYALSDGSMVNITCNVGAAWSRMPVPQQEVLTAANVALKGTIRGRNARIGLHVLQTSDPTGLAVHGDTVPSRWTETAIPTVH